MTRGHDKENRMLRLVRMTFVSCTLAGYSLTDTWYSVGMAERTSFKQRVGVNIYIISLLHSER
jgi:hypothetical protein